MGAVRCAWLDPRLYKAIANAHTALNMEPQRSISIQILGFPNALLGRIHATVVKSALRLSSAHRNTKSHNHLVLLPTQGLTCLRQFFRRSQG